MGEMPVEEVKPGSLGWYEVFYLLTSINPQEVITSFSFAPASAKDQAMAEDFFACRHQPHSRLQSVGLPALGEYFVDKGFEGETNYRRWYLEYGAPVLCPPKRNSKHLWPKRLRRWHAGLPVDVYGSRRSPSSRNEVEDSL